MKFSNILWLLVLSSCVSKAPDSSMGDVAGAVPDSWAATKSGRAGVDTHWVKRFKSSELNKLVNEALAQNQDMKIASERVFRAAEAAGVAGALSIPQASLSLGADRRRINFIGFPFESSSTSNTFAPSLDVSWEPDIWGLYRTKKSAAIAELQADGQDYRAARASLAGRVCKAWFVLAEANEQVSLAKKSLSVREKTESSVQERFERDMHAEGGTASQLRLAQTDTASAKATLTSKMSDRDSSRRQLELLLGRYPTANISGLLTLPSVPSAPPSGLPSELLMRRPDIIAAERHYAASIKRIREAKLAVFPSISLTARGGSSSDSLSHILDSQFGVWSLGANILQPLLTGGRIKSEIRVRDSTQRESLATLHKTVLNAFGEVEQALANEGWLKRREEETREAFELASDAAKSEEASFREGNGDVLSLFTAQARSIELESQYTFLVRLRLINRVDLHLALGGGFNL